MSYTYTFPRPALTVDCIVFSYINHTLHVLLIRRGKEPFKGMWAFPGGFLDLNDDFTLEAAAYRELAEETGLKGITLTQMHTFGDAHRDPRGRIITVAFFGWCADVEKCPVAGADDAADAQWVPLKHIAEMAADHALILVTALQNLLIHIEYQIPNPAWLPDFLDSAMQYSICEQAKQYLESKQ